MAACDAQHRLEHQRAADSGHQQGERCCRHVWDNAVIDLQERKREAEQVDGDRGGNHIGCQTREGPTKETEKAPRVMGDLGGLLSCRCA